MKMKVKVSKLQEAIRRHVKKDGIRFERECAEFEERTKKARAKYMENLADYLADLRSGKEIHERYRLYDKLERGCKFPDPVKKAEMHTDLLVKLDLAEDTILTVDDHSDYMKFLSGKCVC